ncbi:MAG: hypothetical protein ACE5D7_07210 [Fidelibacterota bacterium]
MHEEFDQNITNNYKGKLKISNQWLTYQRNKLMGAIDQSENQREIWVLNRFINLKESPISFALFSIFALLIGYSIGTYHKPTTQIQPANPVNNIMELLTSNKISSIQLDIDQNRDEPYVFKFVSQSDYQYSGNESDEAVILLLEQMLTNTSNPGDRLKLARKLSDTGISNEMAVSVIVKAILAEDNSAIQSILIESLQNNQSNTVRDALLQITMGDYDAPIRMSALNYLKHFKTDPYVNQILKIISISDENPTVRYNAGKLLMTSLESKNNTGEISK